MGYVYIFLTICFTVMGQIVLKWRINNYNIPKVEGIEKLKFIFSILLDPLIISGFLSAFIASIFWMAAMTKFEITKAYPFMSLSPALVFIIGILFLNEQFTWGKIIGIILIALGTFVTVKY